MLGEITPERLLAITDQERRWLNNTKKAFLASDEAYVSGTPEDRCMEELCKAIDTAKTLDRSLRDEDTSGRQNKVRYLEFLESELPSPEEGGVDIPLLDVRTGKAIRHSFPSLIYDIRCMIHENENLNAAEAPNYHIQLDWTLNPHDRIMGRLENGKVICNARIIWNRVREIVAKFITGIDGSIAFAQGKGFTITGSPKLGTIRPE